MEHDASFAEPSGSVATMGSPLRRGPSRLLSLALILVVIVGASALWTFYLSPNHTTSPFYDRHNLPSYVPLPEGLMFQESYSCQLALPNCDETTTWAWTSPQPNNPHVLYVFYSNALSKDGWGRIRGAEISTGPSFLGHTMGIFACHGSQSLDVESEDGASQLLPHRSTLLPVPAGGAILFVALTNADSHCS